MIILIDNNGVLVRYAAALQNNEVIGNHRYGGLLMYLKLLIRLHIKYPHATFITFSDRCGKNNFRKSISSEYKENRKKLSDNISLQLNDLSDILQNNNICHVFHEEYEADDLIASYIACNKNTECIIVSGDKDFIQLLDDKVWIYNPFNNTDHTLIDMAAAQTKYKIPPKHFVIYQALMGDNSDNISGVAGIGKVRAGLLIEECQGDLDAIYKKYSNKYDFSNMNINIQLVTLKKDIELRDIQSLNLNIKKINSNIIELNNMINKDNTTI